MIGERVMGTARSEARRRYSSNEVREKLEEADGALAAGESVFGICGRLGITRQTYYRWRRNAEPKPSRQRAAAHRKGAGRNNREAEGARG